MAYDPRKHHRRSIRLPDYNYSQPGAYFLTLLVKDRVHLFGKVREGAMHENEYGRTVRAVWDQLPERYAQIATDAFVVMPNHVHGIVVITADGAATDVEANDERDPAADADLTADAVRAVRAIHESPRPEPEPEPSRQRQRQKQTSKAARRRMLLPRVVGYWKMNAAKRINQQRGTSGTSVWQRDYYEHVIRNRPALARIRAYIHENPQRWHDDSLNR